jgi:hypothetical protein
MVMATCRSGACAAERGRAPTGKNNVKIMTRDNNGFKNKNVLRRIN